MAEQACPLRCWGVKLHGDLLPTGRSLGSQRQSVQHALKQWNPAEHSPRTVSVKVSKQLTSPTQANGSLSRLALMRYLGLGQRGLGGKKLLVYGATTDSESSPV